jgi:hypothetical protein
MMLIFVGAISMIAGAWIKSRSWRRRSDHRLGLLGTGAGAGVAMSDEARRVARLAELGEAGTHKTYNCGRILYVDYERGELIVEREGRRA